MTPVQICNTALGRIGEPEIFSLEDESSVARACALFYAPTCDEVLRSHRWNFATARATLAKLESAPPFGWSNAFALPADCLRALEVNDSEDGRGCPWAVEGRSLLTNEDSVNLVYIKSIADASQFDSLFCQALAVLLASKLVAKLRGSSSQTAELRAEYERLTAPLARRVDGNENRERKPLLPLQSRFILARSRGA